MIEIHFIVVSLEIGGSERHLSQVLPLLKKEGFSIKVIVLSNKNNLKSFFDNAGIPVMLGPDFSSLPQIIRRPLSLITSVLRLMVSFIINRKAIRHTFLPEAYLLTALAARLTAFKGPLLMSRRSLNNYQQRRTLLSKLENLFHCFTTLALGNSKAVVQQLYAEGYQPQNVKLIYNGIETKTLHTLQEKSQIRKNLELNTDSLIFIIVANLIPYKGHIDLLNALAIITNKLPENWQLLCIGKDSGICKHLKNHAGILGLANNVKFLGSCPDTSQFLAASDIAILCSHEEGFSNAILEAMFAGLPMVVTNVGGNIEAVQDRVTGLVVPPKNTEALADALITLALSPQLRKQYGNAGKERVNKHFTLQKCVEQYASLYYGIHADLRSSQKN